MNLEEWLEELETTKAVLIGVVVTALFYFMVYDDGSRLETSIKNLKQQISTNQNKIEQAKQAVIEKEKFANTKKLLGERFDTLVQYIPEDFSSTEQMKIISNVAKTAGANILKISQTGRGEKFNFYEEIRVDVELVGSYTQIMMFMSGLTRLKKVIVADNISLSTQQSNSSKSESEGGVKINFKSQLVGYRYIDDNENSGGRR
ncbi:MAG: type 4a pilus biogenesis protein PilO [Bdellovibrionales bacterium]|nr:type 4a pilus biogenesis protein PilO [Bdellovibrionales bacterium]